MYSNPIPPPPPTTAQHYSIPQSPFSYEVSETAAKIMELNPQLILGDSQLFIYDPNSKLITLAPSFHELLQLLVDLNELDPDGPQAKSFERLNEVLQKPQGPYGGLIRKQGTERWDLVDNSIKRENKGKIEELLQKMGFVTPKSYDEEIVVDHCILFGARAERMFSRIIRTVEYLKKNLRVNEGLYLLGSTRKLEPEEKAFLQEKLAVLEENRKNFWLQTFNDDTKATEATAFLFLWETQVPQEIQERYRDILVLINSSRKGLSSQGKEGSRPTAEVTTRDWLPYYEKNANRHQSIFAIAEHPYTRLSDQLRASVLTKANKGTKSELLARISKTTFYFASPAPAPTTLISVIFDEVARNVYRIYGTLSYVESLDFFEHLSAEPQTHNFIKK